MKLLLENQDGSRSEFEVTEDQVATISLLTFRGKYYTFQYKVHGENSVLFLEQSLVELNCLTGGVITAIRFIWSLTVAFLMALGIFSVMSGK